jgi:hypothetical protein
VREPGRLTLRHQRPEIRAANRAVEDFHRVPGEMMPSVSRE